MDHVCQRLPELDRSRITKPTELASTLEFQSPLCRRRSRLRERTPPHARSRVRRPPRPCTLTLRGATERRTDRPSRRSVVLPHQQPRQPRAELVPLSAVGTARHAAAQSEAKRRGPARTDGAIVIRSQQSHGLTVRTPQCQKYSSVFRASSRHTAADPNRALVARVFAQSRRGGAPLRPCRVPHSNTRPKLNQTERKPDRPTQGCN